MRILSKFVAAVVLVALSATPLLAAIPCPGQMTPAAHCAPCCPMMTEGMGDMNMAQPADVVGAPDQAQVEQQPCCAAASAESSVPAILREAQGPVTTTSLVASVSTLPSLLPAPLQDLSRQLPVRTERSRVYSRLCTFRI